MTYEAFIHRIWVECLTYGRIHSCFICEEYSCSMDEFILASHVRSISSMFSSWLILWHVRHSSIEYVLWMNSFLLHMWGVLMFYGWFFFFEYGFHPYVRHSSIEYEYFLTYEAGIIWMYSTVRWPIWSHELNMDEILLTYEAGMNSSIWVTNGDPFGYILRIQFMRVEWVTN